MEPSNKHLYSIPDASRKQHLGNVYLIAEHFMNKSDVERIFNDKSVYSYYVPYKLVYLKDFSEITDKPLREALQTHGANLATQVFMPDQYEPYFLLECSDLNDIENAAAGLIEEAENLSKDSVRRAIVNYATKEPEACQKWISDELSGSESEPVVGKTLPYGITPSFKGVGRLLGGMAGAVAGASARTMAIMEEFSNSRENFVANVDVMRNGEPEEKAKAEEEVDKFLTYISEWQKKEIFKMYLAKLEADELQEIIDVIGTPDDIPERSKIKICVEKSNDCINNNGFYRLFCKFADKNTSPLRFNLKSTTIVYLMMLIGKKNNPEHKTTFSFDKNNPEDRALFVKLMTTLYEKNEREANGDYDNLFADEFGNQGRLKDSINNCKKVLENTVQKYENPYTFVPKKMDKCGFTYYLPILPENIVFDESFSDIFLSSSNQA